MELGKTIWDIFQIIIGYNLVLPVFLLIVWYLFIPKGKNKKNLSKEYQNQDYGIIVTAYEQTDNLKSVVSSIKNLNYSNYLIYIVADNCDISDLNFNDEQVILLKPEKTIASNTGSHLYATKHFVRKHDIITIIDSDNLVDKEYINQLNIYFNQGYLAVQGVRAAKNLDTQLSCLDAARDIYYHFYDGKILYQLGSSATLAGSGMAFNADLYQDFLMHHQIKGAGFDKILQYFLVSKNMRIAFAESAVVFDEKTSQSEQLVKQRSRWINTWFKYFSLGFSLLAKGIKNLSINQLLFGLILLRPPLFIFILLSACCLLINVITLNVFSITMWLMAFLLFVTGFMLALLNSNTDSRIYKSLKHIPKFVFLQLVSLLKSRNANKHSVSTKHFHNQEIEHFKD